MKTTAGKDNGWKLDRKPTAGERAIGVAGTLLLLVVGAVGFWFCAFDKKSFIASLLTGLFTVMAMCLVLRFVFTPGRKLQRSGVTAMAAVIALVGATMLIGSIFAPEIRQKLMMGSLGLAGLGGGALNFMKAKKKPAQREQPRADARPNG